MIPVDYIHEAMRARALPALPAAGAFENREPATARTAGDDYFTEEFSPAGGHMIGNGIVMLQGIYTLNYFGQANSGRDVGKSCDIVLARFQPMYTVPFPIAHAEITTYDQLLVSGNPIPYRQKSPFTVAGFALYVITIPWYCQTLRG